MRHIPPLTALLARSPRRYTEGRWDREGGLWGVPSAPAVAGDDAGTAVVCLQRTPPWTRLPPTTPLLRLPSTASSSRTLWWKRSVSAQLPPPHSPRSTRCWVSLLPSSSPDQRPHRPRQPVSRGSSLIVGLIVNGPSMHGGPRVATIVSRPRHAGGRYGTGRGRLAFPGGGRAAAGQVHRQGPSGEATTPHQLPSHA
jgi:hypothetical protein